MKQPGMEKRGRIYYAVYIKIANYLRQLAIYFVLGAGLEPAQPQWPKDFKSFVSTIPPSEQLSVCAWLPKAIGAKAMQR